MPSQIKIIVFAAGLIALLPPALAAQAQTGQALTLADAHRIAHDNNPSFRQSLNSERSGAAAVRSAYGALLPSVSASFGSSLQQGGRQVFSGAELGASSDVIQSSYSLGISLRLSAGSFVNPKIQKANRAALEMDTHAADITLRANVTTQYLTVLQSLARAELQDSLILTAQLQLELARARAGAGGGVPLDVQRAEVALGQVQVALIQARNQADIDKLRLFQLMGTMLPLSTQLTTTFALSDPRISLDTVLAIAQRESPALAAARLQDRSSDLAVRRARTEYLPSLVLGTGFGGYTYQYRDADFLVDRGRATTLGQRESCFSTDSLRVGAGMPSIAAQCALISFGADDESRIRAQNRQYPFDFTRNPGSLNASISIPLFDGFGREQRIADAHIARSNSRESTRAAELAVTTDVTASFLTLASSFRAARLQEENAAKSRLELQYVLEKYRVGSATFVDVADSRALFERAESDRINAVYDFHKVFAALERAVGRPLR